MWWVIKGLRVAAVAAVGADGGPRRAKVLAAEVGAEVGVGDGAGMG